MHDLEFFPISCTKYNVFSHLLAEEESAWMADLGWDYAPIREILVSCMNQNILPGYVAIKNKEALGYSYFLLNRTKGSIGNMYVSRSNISQHIADTLLSMSISGLRDLPRIQRVEAQIMPFNDLNCTDIFIEKGFHYHRRSYLTLDLDEFSGCAASIPTVSIIPWHSSRIPQVAGIVLASYEKQIDAVICSDYRSPSGCESYLRSITDNPGCGTFIPEASFIAMDERNSPCAFILGCRISSGVGMISQIAVHPRYQGNKLGTVLMDKCMEIFRVLGFRRMTLTVTYENRKAYEWYYRLGFRSRKEFGAFTWDR